MAELFSNAAASAEDMVQSIDLGASAGEAQPSLFIGILWLLVIGLMFFAQHHVCDAYFVPAINVFISKMRASDNAWLNRWGEEAVAGATICALGCNGPELASNLISLYTCNDAGIGVVVGSEIFNLLIICGAATLASPLSPLPLERTPFARDCFFYLLSIVLLQVFLSDSKVQWYEAFILLALAVVFVLSVYFTTDIINKIPALKPDEPEPSKDVEKPKGNTGAFHGVEVDVHAVFHSRMADVGTEDLHMTMNPKKHGMLMMGDEEEKNLKPNARGSVGFNFGGDPLMGGNTLYYQYLTEVAVVSEGALRLEFCKPLITLIVQAKSPEMRDKLLKEIEEHDKKVWVHEYDATVVSAFSHLYHTWCGGKSRSIMAKLGSIPEFIIDLVLKATLFAVDVKDIRKESRWVGCFLGAMFWLATFSYLMLEIADQVNFNIPILSEAFLGITICAVGTSLPNAFASVIMAQQGKPGAAIANALGSNVQNVFLAMAFPWVLYMLVPYKDCAATKVAGTDVMATQFQDMVVGAEGLQEGIIWMLLTLALVIGCVLAPPICSLAKVTGVVLCFVYGIYVVETSAKVFGILDKEKLFGVL